MGKTRAARASSATRTELSRPPLASTAIFSKLNSPFRATASCRHRRSLPTLSLRLDLGSRLCDLHGSGLNVNLETIDRLQQLEGVRWQRKVLRGTWIFFVATT